MARSRKEGGHLSPPGLIKKSGPFLLPFLMKEVKRMAKSEPNIPDDVRTTPENEQTVQVAEVPAPEMSAEEAATLAHEGETALYDIGDDVLEPPTPFDIPVPDDVVVPFDKIRETAREVKQTATTEKPEAEKSGRPPNKRGRREKTVQEVAQEAKTEDTRKEMEEQRSE
jgi:ParB family chromosome partitioning protein